MGKKKEEPPPKGPNDLNDPLALLESHKNRQTTVFHNIWNPLLGGSLGFGAAVFSNWGTRKPMFSGIQKHVGLTALGLGLGLYFDDKRNAYLAKRDAVLRHYVELHPEDFPVTERVKYAEIMEPWVPIR